MATPPSEGKLLYHMTHITNMPSILENGLMPRSELIEKGIIFNDIADQEIIAKRDYYKEKLSEYLLFHFYPKNPFDCAVCHRYGIENMVIVTIHRNNSKKNEFYIIPSHPLSGAVMPEIYPYKEGFELVDWSILDREIGRDYTDPIIKNACMAECIMKYTIKPEWFFKVYVYNEVAFKYIKSLENSSKIDIKISPAMFPKQS